MRLVRTRPGTWERLVPLALLAIACESRTLDAGKNLPRGLLPVDEHNPVILSNDGAGNWYGTTLRIYDPRLDAWHILWNDPATNFFSQQIARQEGSTIVQTGPDPRGGSMRWVFSDIQPDSFAWTAERAADDRSWRREVEIRARRM